MKLITLERTKKGGVTAKSKNEFPEITPEHLEYLKLINLGRIKCLWVDANKIIIAADKYIFPESYVKVLNEIFPVIHKIEKSYKQKTGRNLWQDEKTITIVKS